MRRNLLRSKKIQLQFKTGVFFLLLMLGSFLQVFGQTNTWNGSSNANWNTAANWSLGHVPLAAEDVVIPDGIITKITINTSAVCKSFTMSGGGNPNRIDISSGNSLAVTNSVTINAGTGKDDNKEIWVIGGTLTCAAVTMANSGSDNRYCALAIQSNGTVNVSGDITMNAPTNLRNEIGFIDANAGTLNIRGNLIGGGITNYNWNSAPTYTVNFNGTSAGQTIPVNGTNYIYYDLAINNTNSAGATLQAALGTTTLLNNITVGDGTNTSLFKTGNFGIPFGNSKTLTVAANSTMNAGTTSVVFGTGGTATINGTFQTARAAGFSGVAGTALSSSNSPAITLGANSTIEYNATVGGQTVTSRTYSNLTMSNTSGIQTAAGALTVNGNLTIGSGATLAGSTYSHSIAGNWSNNGGTYTSGTGGTVTMNGTTQTIGGTSSTSFNNLTISSGTTTLGANITVTNNLSITTSGTTLACDQYQITGNTSGTMTMAAGTELSIGRNGQWDTNNFPTLFTTAHITLNNTSTVTYFGGGRNNPNNFSNVPNYGNLTASLTSGQNLDAAGNTTINGNLTINSGTILRLAWWGLNAMTIGGQLIDNGIFEFDVYSGQTVNVGGNLSGTGTISMTGGSSGAHTLNLNGQNNSIGTLTTDTYNSTVNYGLSGNQQIFASSNYRNLTLSGSGIKTASGAITVSGTTAINGVTFNSGGFSSSLGILTLSGSGSTIALGTGSHSITINDSSSASWTGSLTIMGWTGTAGSSGTAGKIFVGVGGLSTTQLSNVSFTGGYTSGAQILPATGELVPLSTGPIITVGTLTAFSDQCINTTSAEKSYNVSGSNLTGNIVITPPVGFQISTTSGSGFVSNPGTLTLTQTGGNVPSTPIYVRFIPISANNYSDNLSHTSTGATTKNVAVTGAGINTLPTIAAPTSASVTSNSAVLGGDITSTGCSNVTERGIYWSTSSGFADGAGTKVSETPGPYSSGVFTIPVSGLSATTVYYYKAFATNSGGTVYTAQGTFTTATPLITVGTITDFGYQAVNTVSVEKSYTVTGTNLIASVIVTPPTGFEISTTSGSGYSSSAITLTPTSGSVNQTIYVVFHPVLTQAYSGNINHTSTGAIARDVAISGTSLAPTGACAFGNNTSAGLTITPCINMTSNPIQVSTMIDSRQYFVMNVIKGLTYEVYTTENPRTSDALKLTVYDESTGTFVANSESNTGNPTSTDVDDVYLSFTSPISGQVRVLINHRSDCNASTKQDITTYVNVSGGSNSQDDHLAAGTNIWIGHIYDGTNFNNYLGYYNQTETFKEGFGTSGAWPDNNNDDATCFSNINSNEAVRASLRDVSFSARYLMVSTKRGLYHADMTGDDGNRLFVDGVQVYSDWSDHSPRTNSNVLIPMSGNSLLTFEYYENGGQNVVGFNNLIRILANNLNSNVTQNICLGSVGSAISGDTFESLPTGISLSGTGYQWTYSTTPTGTRMNISGATGATYTPDPSVAPFNAAGTYYVFRNAMLRSTNNVTPNPYVATNESNAATVIISQQSSNPSSASASSSTICSGSSTTLTLNGGGGALGEMIRWYSGSCDGPLVGNGNNLVVSPTTTTTYYGRYENDTPCNYNSACASIAITVTPNATIGSVSGASPLCIGSTANYTANGVVLGGGTGAWSTSDARIATVDASGLVTGVANGSCDIIYTITSGCGGTQTAKQSLTVESPGDPVVFGSGLWNVYVYQGNNIGLSGIYYKGYYTESKFSFSTAGRWGINGSPDEATGYQGCAVTNDNHTFVYKREGFPSGMYQITVGHDDSYQLYIDGTRVSSSGAWDGGNPEVLANSYTLTGTSKIEFRVAENGGESRGALTFTEVCTNPTNGGTIAGAQTICTGFDPVAFTSSEPALGQTGTLEYKWQYSTIDSPYSWQETGATGLIYDDNTALTADRWYRRLARVDCKTDWSGAAGSNVLKVTVTVVPTATISYSGSPFCTSGSTPQPVTISGTGAYTGGTYASTSGLTIDTSTGAITLGTSTAGTYMVTYTVAASGGCSVVTATTNVTIGDTTPPLITNCLSGGEATCVKDIPPAITTIQEFIRATGPVTDNCTATNDLILLHNDVIIPGLSCEVRRVYTITDASGNTASCTQLFSITDTEAPVINSVVDLQASPNDNSCGANLHVDAPTKVSENCSLVDEGAYYEYTLAGRKVTGHGSFDAIFPEGITLITWTVTDLCGHVSAQKTQTVQVEFKMTAISYDNGSTATGLGSGLQPMQTSTHEYFVDNKIPESGYTYTWRVFRSDGITAVNSSLYTIANVSESHIKITFTTITTGNYILSVIKTKTGITCEKPKTLSVTIVENTFDTELKTVGNSCQAGETGTPSTIRWEVVFAGNGSSPFNLHYTVNLNDKNNASIAICTGTVSNITLSATTSELTHSSGCSNTGTMPYMRVVKTDTNACKLFLEYTMRSVTATDFNISIQIQGSDQFTVSEIKSDNNAETLQEHGVPNTSAITTN